MKSWRTLASCAPSRWPLTDPQELTDRWFAGNTSFARSVCARCPVAAECLSQSLIDGDHWYGIFGGLDPEQRRVVNRVEGRHEWSSGCGCEYCVAVTAATSSPGGIRDTNGPNATHGRIKTYRRGCHCAACTLAMYLKSLRRRKDTNANAVVPIRLHVSEQQACGHDTSAGDCRVCLVHNERIAA